MAGREQRARRLDRSSSSGSAGSGGKPRIRHHGRRQHWSRWRRKRADEEMKTSSTQVGQRVRDDDECCCERHREHELAQWDMPGRSCTIPPARPRAASWNRIRIRAIARPWTNPRSPGSNSSTSHGWPEDEAGLPRRRRRERDEAPAREPELARRPRAARRTPPGRLHKIILAAMGTANLRQMVPVRPATVVPSWRGAAAITTSCSAPRCGCC